MPARLSTTNGYRLLRRYACREIDGRPEPAAFGAAAAWSIYYNPPETATSSTVLIMRPYDRPTCLATLSFRAVPLRQRNNHATFAKKMASFNINSVSAVQRRSRPICRPGGFHICRPLCSMFQPRTSHSTINRSPRTLTQAQRRAPLDIFSQA